MSGPVELKALPPKDALDYFRSKGYKKSFDFRDIEPEEHAYSFTVAKAMRTDILQDIRGSIDDALAKGTTFETFKDSLKPTLQEKGWWGVKEMVDPATGEKREVKLGSSRRLKTIFDTNMRTAYAAGQWQQIQAAKGALPYLRYVCMMDGRERPEHRAWHNTVKPVDDPWWNTHYPPCGWGCRCTVQQIGDADLQDLGLKLTTFEPDGPPVNVVNRRTGQLMRVPQGIDPSFAYNPGKSRYRALTPPPVDRPLEVPYSGTSAKVEMPATRTASKKLLLPKDLSHEQYVQKFLGEFGAQIGKPKVFTDVTGEPLVISEEMFKDARGKWKVTKGGRDEYLLMLAASIREPDEIWHLWEEYPKGRYSLTRRYLTRFDVDGKEVPMFTYFDTGAAGWRGVTTYQAKAGYINKQRQGTLVYRRSK